MEGLIALLQELGHVFAAGILLIRILVGKVIEVYRQGKLASGIIPDDQTTRDRQVSDQFLDYAAILIAILAIIPFVIHYWPF